MAAHRPLDPAAAAPMVPGRGARRVHARAAGALIDGNIESVRHKVVAAAREFLRAEDKEGVA